MENKSIVIRNKNIKVQKPKAKEQYESKKVRFVRFDDSSPPSIDFRPAKTPKVSILSNLSPSIKTSPRTALENSYRLKKNSNRQKFYSSPKYDSLTKNSKKKGLSNEFHNKLKVCAFIRLKILNLFSNFFKFYDSINLEKYLK